MSNEISHGIFFLFYFDFATNFDLKSKAKFMTELVFSRFHLNKYNIKQIKDSLMFCSGCTEVVTGHILGKHNSILINKSLNPR